MTETPRPDRLAALAAEATRTPNEPVLVRQAHGRTWRFGQPDVRPSRLRRYGQLAEDVTGRGAEALTGAEAVELSAVAEEMLRSALAPQDRDAFDEAPFGGAEIGALIADYFAALGPTPGESAASPSSSRATRTRSRPTSRSKGRR